MKKEYGKPLLYIEDFTITQNIATCIEHSMGERFYKGDCTFMIYDKDEEETFIYYYSNMNGKCNQLVDVGGNDFVGCYYGPNKGGAFGS